MRRVTGVRSRAKTDFDISPFAADMQITLRALQKYAMILADMG